MPDNADNPPIFGGDATILGEKLRDKRSALGLTLKDVADHAGFSVGFISQIERGITTPSLASLVAVSRVLGVHLSDLLSQPKVTAPITRHAERPHYAIGSNSITYQRLSTSFPGNVLRSVIIHEPPGYRGEPNSHEGEEIYFVLDGALTVELEGEEIILETGDSLHFPSHKVHSSWNHTDQPATILHTCTMDVFGDEPEPPGEDHDFAVRRNAHRRSAARDTKIKSKKGNNA